MEFIHTDPALNDRALMLVSWDRHTAVNPKRPYLLLMGGGHSNPNWLWEWVCARCGYRRRRPDRAELEAEIKLHDCQRVRPDSLAWRLARGHRFRSK